jgi:anti-sigma regulatory factor (Ser/Thr protein kinase)
VAWDLSAGVCEFVSLHVTSRITVQIHEQLPKDPGSAATARRALDRLEGRVDPQVLANARLLVTELVANAVEHAQNEGELMLDVSTDSGRLRVGVSDPGPGFEPHPRRPDSPQESGWGLHFVDQLADRWAVELDDRAHVWFEMST